MSNKYYNAAVDNTWDNVLNWWSNSAHTVPAGAAPVDGDTAYIDGEMDTPPASATPTLVAIIVGSLDAGPANPVNFSGVVGPSTWENSYQAAGLLSGNAAFHGNTIMVNGASVQIGYDLSFYDTTSVQVGADTSYAVSVDFYDFSFDAGMASTDSTNVTFHDFSSCQNASGNLRPSANITFADQSSSPSPGSSITGQIIVQAEGFSSNTWYSFGDYSYILERSPIQRGINGSAILGML